MRRCADCCLPAFQPVSSWNQAEGRTDARGSSINQPTNQGEAYVRGLEFTQGDLITSHSHQQTVLRVSCPPTSLKVRTTQNVPVTTIEIYTRSSDFALIWACQYNRRGAPELLPASTLLGEFYSSFARQLGGPWKIS